MACRFIPLGDGVTAVACTRGGRARCKGAPGCDRVAIKQCDYPVTRKGVAGTCDVYLCGTCAKSLGPETDRCPAHARLEAARAKAVTP